MSAITRIEISHHQLPLMPPFVAAWDSRPRTTFPVTVVRVVDDQGRMGVGAGDAMHGFADYRHHFLGHDPLDLERHAAVLANIEFHAGRPWPVDVALWDLAGHILDRPLWDLVGGAGNTVRTYASSGVHRSPADTAALARRLAGEGFQAFKLRFGRPRLDDDLRVLHTVRDAVGRDLELMVDCNQGWRMPWDVAAPWSVDHAVTVAEALAVEGVYWMEEPLHRGDYDGYAALRRQTAVPIAGGEMTREPYEFRELLHRGCLDVFQPDAVCSQGISGLRTLAAEVAAAGHTFSPHTWGNGIGLLANAHLTAGTVGTTFLELPLDPPEWTPERRDFILTEPVTAEGGWLRLTDRPGLGCTLDEAALARTASAVATFH
jgi:L-alanine-DL-glutamate epimerase-like enolase superfamily enzyme